MNETTPPKASSLPLVVTIVVAVAGLAAAGVFFSQSRSLQTKLDDTTRELQQTKTRLDDTTKELQQTKGELARTQASLTTNETRLVEASRQLDQTKSELEQARSQVSRMEPLAAKAREMPIAVGFRKAVLGSGFVLTLQNKSSKTLALTVTVADATGQKTKPFRVVLDGRTEYGPAPTKEIGHAEGWAFASGDSVEIACAGYDTIKKTLQ